MAAENKTAMGRAAEELVAEHLEQLGLTLLARNVRLSYLEIDLVAREGRVIALIEVRRRGNTARTSCFGSVNGLKRERLRRAGERLWRRYFRGDADVDRLRFDLAAVSFKADGVLIEYVRGAFV